MPRPVGSNIYPPFPEDKNFRETPAEKLEESSFQILRQNVGRYVRKKVAKTQENVGYVMKMTGGLTFLALCLGSGSNKDAMNNPRVIFGIAAGLSLAVAGDSLEEAGRKKYEAILEEELPPAPETKPLDKWSNLPPLQGF